MNGSVHPAEVSHTAMNLPKFKVRTRALVRFSIMFGSNMSTRSNLCFGDILEIPSSSTYI